MNQIIESQAIPAMAAVDAPMSVVEMKQQVNLIQQVLAEVMQAETHYGVIPGTGNKPSLLKPGAEKIMATFRLAADPIVEDLSDDTTARYRVMVRLISPSGRCIGAGIGECSGAEKKYRWRAAVCTQEFEETPVDRRQELWKKGWNNKPPQKVQQIMTEKADTANTVLKMAKKRALVDAVLTATAASDIFTQDIEDLPDEMKPMASDNRSHTPAGNQAKPTSEEGQKLIDQLTKVAEGGWPDLQKAWGDLTEAQRAAVGPGFGAIKKLADSKGKG